MSFTTRPHALVRLVERAASMTQPFNSQDAILILKALHALRFKGFSVRHVCEKAAFSVASASPETIPIAVLVDTAITVSALNAGSLPVARKILPRRFKELRSATDAPQTIVKAAVVLMKSGRKHADPRACWHVLRVLEKCIARNPSDTGLKLAFIGLFPYAPNTATAPGDEAAQPSEPASPTLAETALTCGKEMLDSGLLSSLSSTRAWQALHLFVLLSSDREEGSRGGAARGWAYRYCQEIQLQAIGTVPFAQFVQDFFADMGSLLNSPCRRTLLNECATAMQERPGFTTYDLVKIANAASSSLQTLIFSRADGMSHETTGNHVANSGLSVSVVPTDESNSCADLYRRLLHCSIESLVRLTETENRASPISFASVWQLFQKYLDALGVSMLARSQSLMEDCVLLVHATNAMLQSDEHSCDAQVSASILFSACLATRSVTGCSAMNTLIHGLSISVTQPYTLASLMPQAKVKIIYALSRIASFASLEVSSEAAIVGAGSGISARSILEDTVVTSGMRRSVVPAESALLHAHCWTPEDPLIAAALAGLVGSVPYSALNSRDVTMLFDALRFLLVTCSQRACCMDTMGEKVDKMPVGVESLATYLLSGAVATPSVVFISQLGNHTVSVMATCLALLEFLPATSPELVTVLHRLIACLHTAGTAIAFSSLHILVLQLDALRQHRVHISPLLYSAKDAIITLVCARALDADLVISLQRTGRHTLASIWRHIDVLRRQGTRLNFVTPASKECRPDIQEDAIVGVTTGDSTRRGSIYVFTVDVRSLLNARMLTPLDAARVLRLMGDELRREAGNHHLDNTWDCETASAPSVLMSSATCCALDDVDVAELCTLALHHNTGTNCMLHLLYLLSANKSPLVSGALFSDQELQQVCRLVSEYLVHLQTHLTTLARMEGMTVTAHCSETVEAARIVRGVMESQLLARAKGSDAGGELERAIIDICSFLEQSDDRQILVDALRARVMLGSATAA